MNAIGKINMPITKQPEIAGVTYGGTMHRFATDHAVRTYCNMVLGGYYGHGCLADGSTWIPTPDGYDAIQIGWNR